MTRIKRSIRTTPAHRIVGIDASLTSTGYSYRYNDKLYTGRVEAGLLRGPYRLGYIRDRVQAVIDVAKPTMIVFEDYAMGRSPKVSMAFHIGELGGVLKTLFWEQGIDVMLVAPKSLKMVIAGNGNAGKPDMCAAIEQTFGYTIAQHDEADAVGLMLVGELSKGIKVVESEVRDTLRLHTLDTFPVTNGKLQSIAEWKRNTN